MMNKVLTFILMILLGVAGLIGSSCSEKEKSPEGLGQTQTGNTDLPSLSNQAMDAFSGQLVNRSLYADYEGKRVYFCCDQSKQDFIKDPQRYFVEFRRQGVILESTPQGN